MTPEELQRLYGSGKRDFAWVDLQEQCLDGMGLTGAGLGRAKLNRSSLREAQLDNLQARKLEAEAAVLCQASLRGAVLWKANFAGADLSEADLTGADLAGANLVGANLSGAVLHGVRCDRANFTGANLVNAQWQDVSTTEAVFDNAVLPDGSDWETWQNAHPQPIAEDDPPDLAEDPPPADPPPPARLIRPVLSLEGYRAESVYFEPRGLQGQARWRNLPRMPLALQGASYFTWSLLLGGYGAPFLVVLLLGLAAVAWWGDRKLTLFGPLFGANAVSILLLFGRGNLTIIGLFLFIPLVAVFLNMLWFGYGMRNSLRNTIWLCGVAYLFLAVMNLLILTVGGGVNLFAFLLLLMATAAGTISSSLWIGLAKVQYSLNQAVKICALVAFGSGVLGWCLGAIAR